MSRTPSHTTVGELVERGVEEVDAFCVGCGNMWRSPITILPDGTTLAKVAALMMCPTCGGRDIEVDPTRSGGVQ